MMSTAMRALFLCVCASAASVRLLAQCPDGAERWSEAEAMADVNRALGPDHPLTLLFADFLHDACHRHLERLPADTRRVAMSRAWRAETLGGDSATAFDLERRLGDPMTRALAIGEIAARSATIGMALHLAYDGDDATLAFLGSLVGKPNAGDLSEWIAYGLLGPRRRAEPRFVAALARLGISR
jgi:hypothetical protein